MPNEEPALLIDADMLLLRAAAGCQFDIELQPGMWVSQLNHHQTKDVFWESVQLLADQVKAAPEHAILCWTSRSMFRRELWPEYKANRKNVRKPPGYHALIAEMITHPQSVMHDQIEADDLISIISRTYGKNTRHVICSGDKDMKQVPGIHLWLDQPGLLVTPAEGMMLFWHQAVTGDATDGYPGAKGVGPATVAKLFDGVDPFDVKTCWSIALAAYRDAGHKDYRADALRNAQLAQLLHPNQYDFATFEVFPWHPPASLLDLEPPPKATKKRASNTKSSSKAASKTGTKPTPPATD